MKVSRGLAAGTAVALATLTATGCGGGSAAGSGVTVVASFYPLAYVAGQVGGDLVEVADLTQPGVEPHDLELKPQQLAAVQDADVLLYESGFQAAVDDAVGQADRADSATLDVTDVVTLHPLPGTDTPDPHVWLDPQAMTAITAAVVDRLSTADPTHARTYARNGAALNDRLHALDRDFRVGLADCEVRQVVTGHAAFGYLTARYGLTQVPIAAVDPSSEPSAEQLARISDLVRRDDISTVFTEELSSPRVADTIAAETGARTATLSPVEGLSSTTADDDYFSLMRRNLAALRAANRCA